MHLKVLANTFSQTFNCRISEKKKNGLESFIERELIYIVQATYEAEEWW